MEWNRNGKKRKTTLELKFDGMEWKWNGNGMEMEQNQNGKFVGEKVGGIFEVMERKQNGNEK